jgi:predicted enzyme related to lactoylglutathione lyase
MPSRWYTLVVDCTDVRRVSDFWKQVLDWQVVYESDDEIVIARDESTYPGIIFGTVPEAKTIKNRLHIDLNPDDQDAEVERLIGLGATRAEVGQSEAAEPVRWVVLADPEGNEFCVLTAREQ